MQKNKRNQENNNKNKKYNNERNNGNRGGRGRGRKFDRQSGTGRPSNEEKKSGHGKANWGGIQEHIETEAEILEQNEENPVENVTEEVEPKVQVMTLEEFEKQRAEKE